MQLLFRIFVFVFVLVQYYLLEQCPGKIIQSGILSPKPSQIRAETVTKQVEGPGVYGSGSRIPSRGVRASSLQPPSCCLQLEGVFAFASGTKIVICW